MGNSSAEVEDGWEQLEAGVALIRWSKLACWDHVGVKFAASNGFCGHCGQPPREAEIRRLWSQSS